MNKDLEPAAGPAEAQQPGSAVSERSRLLANLLQHPFIVACFTAVIGAMVAGGFALWSAYVQSSATVAANQPPRAPPRLASPLRAEDLHVTPMQFGAQKAMVLSDAAYQLGEGYEARLEGCTPLQNDRQALCLITIKAKSVVTVTNAENPTEAFRREGDQAIACCLFFNDGENGFHIFKAKTDKAAFIGRRTISPPDKLSVIVAIPDLNKGLPIDSLLFSIGGGDPGVRFPVTVRPFEAIDPDSNGLGTGRQPAISPPPQQFDPHAGAPPGASK